MTRGALVILCDRGFTGPSTQYSALVANAKVQVRWGYLAQTCFNVNTTGWLSKHHCRRSLKGTP